jgi:hypothetical protein
MKTIPVKLAAAALGISNRAVIYRLEKGRLRGEQRPNQFGTLEWNIYPNKEIQEGLKKLAGAQGVEETQTTSETSTIDAEFTVDEDPGAESAPPIDRETVRLIAEEMMRPLVQTIQQQTMALADKDRLIEEKDRNLRLLPDLQRIADEKAKAVELKHFELDALRKQLDALEQQRAEEANDREQLALMRAEVEKLKKPWWKKFFLPAEE